MPMAQQLPKLPHHTQILLQRDSQHQPHMMLAPLQNI